MWNPFKKKSSQVSDDSNSAGDVSDSGQKEPQQSQPETPKMGMIQKLAMKKLAKMSPQEQQKMMQEALNPKNKDKMTAVMEQMKKSGMISEEQYRAAKDKLGL